MNIQIFEDNRDIVPGDFEIVERKGVGHPDTLADALAERLSNTYSKFTLDRFGTILRHQFDKLTLMGGKTNVQLGYGEFVSPIRLLLNGRATTAVGGDTFDVKDMLVNECELFLNTHLRNFNFKQNCHLSFETTSNSTRGLTDSSGTQSINYRFHPRSIDDLPESLRPLANDTAVGCAFAPFSRVEQLVLSIESFLTSIDTIKQHPWLGTDIKIMAHRIKNAVNLTLAVPQISKLVGRSEEYIDNGQTILRLIGKITNQFDDLKITIFVNPSDDPGRDIMYLRYTGSSIESGDEGVVGRGNRIGGIISSCRPFSIEGINGKNPAYHAGKIYSAAAWEIANRIWNSCSIPVEVYVISQIDRPLDDPWKVIINCSGKADPKVIHDISTNIISNISTLTMNLLNGVYPTF